MNETGKAVNRMDETQARRLVDAYGDMILRVSLGYLRERGDAEDVCQTVLLKFLASGRSFTGTEQEKAWMLRTAINCCKDQLKSAFRRRTVALEAAEGIPAAAREEADAELWDALRRLPEKYRVSLYLYYYEEYSAREIAALLGTRENTVSAWLSRGRRKLRQILEETEEPKGAVRHEG